MIQPAFDLRNAVTRPGHDPFAGYAARYGDEEPEPILHPLDQPEMVELHKRLMALFAQELDRQRDNREQMALDEEFYDGAQWDEEDAAALLARGQMPLVFNYIAPTINWLLGSERRTRVDYKVLGRTAEDAKGAEIKSALLKYHGDVNNLPFERSQVFKQQVVAGLGVMHHFVRWGEDGLEVVSQAESWRHFLFDSRASRPDQSDSRYQFHFKMLDLDVARMLYNVPPERMEVLTKAVSAGLQFGVMSELEDEAMVAGEDEFHGFGYNVRTNSVTHIRERVRVIEAWYKVPENAHEWRGGPLHGQRWDREDPTHLGVLQQGQGQLIQRFRMSVRCAAFTSAGLLWEGPSPYAHNRFPFVLYWGNRRARDGMPYGAVRGLRDLQFDLNKRASKALYILSTNKIIMDDGAVDDINALAEEVSRPDGIIVKNPNKMLELNVDRDLAPAHLQLMQQNAQMIQSVSGVTDELLGRTTNAVSGAAITARQEQGSLQTSLYFDNARFGRQQDGQIQLALYEQWWDEQRTFRVTNERGQESYIQANDPQQPESIIGRTKADFIIDETPYSASYRQGIAEQMVLMMQRLGPELAAVLLPTVVELMDPPNRDELVKLLRQKLGVPDPNQTEATPEQIAQQQAQARQQQLAEQQAQLALAELQNKVAKLRAETDAIAAKTLRERVGGVADAVQAAATVASAPGVAEAADQILRDAGHMDAGDAPIPQPPEGAMQ